MSVQITVDTREFNAALREYLVYSKRSLAEICNKRAVNICFKAIRHTPAARKERITRDLKQPSQIYPDAPIGAILVNHYRGREGKKGLYGEQMKLGVQRLITHRARTAGYIKSGWIGAIRDLSPHAKIFRRPPRVELKGKPKGYGVEAMPGRNPTAQIVNFVDGAIKVGSAALQHAMNLDAADMRQYAARKMQQDANKYNAR